MAQAADQSGKTEHDTTDVQQVEQAKDAAGENDQDEVGMSTMYGICKKCKECERNVWIAKNMRGMSGMQRVQENFLVCCECERCV